MRRNYRPLRHTLPLLLILSIAAFSIAGCGAPADAGHAAPPLPKGWNWYQDAQVHGQMPVAPGWNAASFNDAGPLDNPGCAYAILFYPHAGSVASPLVAEEHELRLIFLTVDFSCLPWKPSDDQYFKPESHLVTIDGQQTTMYDNDLQGVGIQRVAITTFGGHQYAFSLQSQPESATQGDLAIFMQMLHGFQYTGS